MFNVTNENDKLYLAVSTNDDDFSLVSTPPVAYEINSLDDEIKRNIIKDSYFTEENSSFIIKPNFSTSNSFIDIN